MIKIRLFSAVLLFAFAFSAIASAQAVDRAQLEKDLLRSFHFDDTDVLVAFRIVRQDEDGSVILHWKLLKKFPAPKSIRDPQN